MSYNYSQFQAALALEMAIPGGASDTNFQAILPTIIDYAEQRLYRELDLLFATTAQTFILTANNRNFSVAPGGYPQNQDTPQLLIFENLNVITPAGTTNPDLGTRNQLPVVSREFLDAVWNSSSTATVPEYAAPITDTSWVLGPWPDQAYTIEVVGKYRPLPLYNALQANGTFLSLILPDLFFAAAMISATGYQKNFGAQADDPKMAQSWEQQYQLLLPSAKNEEVRKKFRGAIEGSSESAPFPPPPQGP